MTVPLCQDCRATACFLGKQNRVCADGYLHVPTSKDLQTFWDVHIWLTERKNIYWFALLTIVALSLGNSMFFLTSAVSTYLKNLSAGFEFLCGSLWVYLWGGYFR